jgi:hypothetical protein
MKVRFFSFLSNPWRNFKSQTTVRTRWILKEVSNCRRYFKITRQHALESSWSTCFFWELMILMHS